MHLKARSFVISLPILGFAAFWSAEGQPANAQVAVNNTLTSEEQSSGYTQLFNGQDLSNWKSYRTTTPPASWVVQTVDGIKQIQVVAGGVGHLISKQNDFQNFDLKVEWKVPEKGNSGIFIRYLEISDWAGASGPEAQVVDINHSDGQQSLHRAGTCYDMLPLDPGRDLWWKPTGQWNQFRIVAYNSKVAHYGNGKKLLEYDMTSKVFLDAYSVSKYRTYPDYKTIHAGAIYLQHHGEVGIGYRNMRIKKLDKDPWATGSPYVKADGKLVDDMTFEQNFFPATVSIFMPNRSKPGIAKRALRNDFQSIRQGQTLRFNDFGIITPERLLGREP